MKKLLLLISLTFGIATSAIIVKEKTMTTNENALETKTFKLEAFNAVKSSQAIQVEIVKSSEEKLVVTSNYISKLDIKVKNKVLYIRYQSNSNIQNADTKITVYAKDLNKAEAESASTINIKNTFNASEQTFESRSAGKIVADSKVKIVTINTSKAGVFQGKIDTENLNIVMNGASKVVINGSAKKAEIKAGQASSLNANKMDIETVNVVANSAAIVTLNVLKELNAYADSASVIKYKKRPETKLSTHKTSNGVIHSL